jgi:hypothetical protein
MTTLITKFDLMNGGSTPTGAVNRAINLKLSEIVSVKDFGAVGDGSIDDTTAIQNAINSLGASGGQVLFPPGKYLTSSTLQIGNGTSSSWSTLGAVKLKGLGVGAGIGVNDPLGGAIIISSVPAGAAIQVNGPLAGWGIEDLFIESTESTTTANGVVLKSATQGYIKGCVFNNFTGISLYTTCQGNNTNVNIFENLYIYMSPAHNDAIGILLDGSGDADTSENTFNGLHIQPGNTTHTGIILRYCDSNDFYRTIINPLPSGIAQGIIFDYANSSATGFPGANFFFHLDPFGNTIFNTGSPNLVEQFSPNRIYGFSQQANALIPTNLPGTSIERMSLSSNMTFYVSTAGSDTVGSGLYADPWATIQHAWTMITSYYDLNGFTATIQLFDGTYTSGLNAIGTPVGGNIVIQGNSSNIGNVILNSSSDVITSNNSIVTIQYLTIEGGSTVSLFADNGGGIFFNNIAFAACTGPHIWANRGGFVRANGNYSITGNASNHWLAQGNGVITVDSITITVSAGLTFSNTFASALMGGYIECYSNTFSTTTATGIRYISNLNGVINTNGGGANYLPGNSAGSTATGGQYV